MLSETEEKVLKLIIDKYTKTSANHIYIGTSYADRLQITKDELIDVIKTLKHRGYLTYPRDPVLNNDITCIVVDLTIEDEHILLMSSADNCL